ncbi:MAG TPA: phosphoglycerate dehydrogenase [Terriglobales bacterium]|nr:phosphoglycerate dehydrogenase [Terriglobales bacterium]
MKIVVAEKISPAAIDVLRQEPGWTIVTADQIPAGQLPSALADADALIVRSAVKVTADLLEHAPKLRVIGRAGIGVDNIELEAATRKGIAVMNTPGANAVAVAEHTLGLMLSLARHLCRASELTKSGKWEKKSLEGRELRGKTLGIIGLGRIGMEVARRARAFEMTAIAHDPYISPEIARENKVELKNLDEVFAQSDYLTLHMALTPQTAGFINATSIARMKKGVRIINCARGELVDEAALAEAIKSGHVAGAAIDVFLEEPPKNTPLFPLENVVATPHIAGSTHEAQEAVGVQIAKQVREYLSRGVIQNAVNVPSVSYEEYVQMQPFITLGQRLGAFLAQATGEEGGVREIALRYTGRVANWQTQLLRNAVTMGVLNSMLAEEANLVNAEAIAGSRGVRVRESAKEKTTAGGGAGDVIEVTLRTGVGQHTVAGTVLHGRSPRILSVDGLDIEAPLAHDLIFLRNRDVPGVIGRIGTILGEHQINIASFSLGRVEEPGPSGPSGDVEAVSVIQVDTPAPEKVLAELRKIPAITKARAIQLG